MWACKCNIIQHLKEDITHSFSTFVVATKQVLRGTTRLGLTADRRPVKMSSKVRVRRSSAWITRRGLIKLETKLSNVGFPSHTMS